MEAAPAAVMERERLTAEMAFRDPDGGEPAPSIVIKIRRRLPDFARNIKLKYVKLGIRLDRSRQGGKYFIQHFILYCGILRTLIQL